jgi:hypothetical protein
MADETQTLLRLTDFRMAGFLSVRKAVLHGTEVNARREVVFLFEDAKGEATALLTSFPSSQEQKYDAACRAMHDLVKMVLAQKRD